MDDLTHQRIVAARWATACSQAALAWGEHQETIGTGVNSRHSWLVVQTAIAIFNAHGKETTDV